MFLYSRFHKRRTRDEEAPEIDNEDVMLTEVIEHDNLHAPAKRICIHTYDNDKMEVN